MGKFYQRISVLPPVYDRDRARQSLEGLKAAIDADPGLSALGRLIDREQKVRDLLTTVAGVSPYLSGLMIRDPHALLGCLTNDPDKYLARLGEQLARDMADASAQKQAMALLRDHKRRIALAIALADIGGVWSIDDVTEALSDAAGRSVTCAVRFLLTRAAHSGNIVADRPDAPEQGCGYFVLGMGKLGARELNYSSDIDLIVFFDTSRSNLKEGIEPAPFYVRLTRDLVRLLQERTAQGYVWRTDLRLRPDPGATQLALSTDAGFSYYESFGQNWERAALIKARVIAGDIETGKMFLDQLAPFIWRKYLDFAALADIHAMKRRVHEFKGHAQIAVAGHDIKLGRGGIREIEFFTQTQQLIAGGRQADLRTPQTLATLEMLARKGWIEAPDAEELTEAYRFLRKLEHRLQMIADEQTHKLPSDPDDLERIACFCGFEGADAFSDALVEQLTTVQKHYDALFVGLPVHHTGGQAPVFRGDDESPETLAALKESGFDDPEAVSEIIRGWRSGRYAATRSQRARDCLAEILPELLKAIVTTGDPGAALISFDRFLRELPTGVQLFSLLRSTPSLLRLIADIMGTAPRLARVLSRRSQIFDAVLDPGFFGDLPSRNDLEDLISRELATAQDYQDCLDRARKAGQEQAFLIGVRILSRTIGADQAGGAYARLARALIAALHSQVEQELIRTHGAIEGGEAVVIAMGKLGGREMTAASDLDLIIVYDFAEDAGPSDGARPLAPGQYYARFTQRLISALSAQTAQGSLYDVDMRLRPSGHAGPVATHFDGFVDYQNNHAWTWEHLALTRARIVSGPDKLREKVEGAIRDVLTRKRDREKIAADVHEMRARIDKQKSTGDGWDIKQVRGGLVDLELIAQFLQIIAAHGNPQVLDQNTARSLEKLAAAGVLTPADAQVLIPAASLYHDLNQLLRLCLERPFDPNTASTGLKTLLARAADMPDFTALEDHLFTSIAGVRQLYERIVC